jgi:hypothetical protein
VGWILLLATAGLSTLLYREGGGPLGVLLALAAAGLLGAGLASWQWGIRLDDGGARVTRWSGPGFALFRTSLPREALTGVRLDKEIKVVPHKGTFVHYLARVTQHGGAGDFYLKRTLEGHLARDEAEAIAKLLHMDLRDESGDSPVVREAAYLDEPLVARMRRLGLAPPMPAQAATGVARVQRSAGRAIVIEVPPFGFRAKSLAPALAIAAAIAVMLGVSVATEVGGADSSPSSFVVPMLLVMGVLLLPLLVNAIDVALRRETITVSQAGIEVRTAGLAGKRTRRIPAAAIEEILAPAPLPGLNDSNVDVTQVLGIVHPATQVLVRTDSGDTALGRSLPLGERRWLRDALVHALNATAGGHAQAAATDAREGEAAAGRGRLARRALAGAAAAGILLALAEVAGLWHWAALTGGSVAEPEVDYARYELKPGPGTGNLRMYGRGARASVEGKDLRLSVEEVLLIPSNPRASTDWRDLSVSVHRAVGGGWQLVGHAETKGGGPAIAPGTARALPGPHAFLVRGAGDACRETQCWFRLHVVGSVGRERPGWEVTDMAPLVLRP